MALVAGAEGTTMDKEFDSKLKIQNNPSNGGTVQRSKSFAFRAPQENFTVNDFELGKIYGVGSYSKVLFLFIPFDYSLFISANGFLKQ